MRNVDSTVMGCRSAMWRIGIAILATVLGLGSARAQLVSDVVPRDRIISPKDQVDQDMADSRFRLGPVRLIPSFDVSNAGYNSNVFGHPQNPQGDWTAAVNAGTKLIVPFGSKIYFTGDVFPGYTWYAKFSDLSNFTGTAGAALSGYFNHLSFQVGARGNESVVVLNTAEVPAPTLSKTAHVFGRLDVDLTSAVAFFAGVDGDKVRDSQPGVPLPDRSQVQRYNRTDEAAEGGFRYKLGNSWTIAPEVQYTTTRFVLLPDDFVVSPGDLEPTPRCEAAAAGNSCRNNQSLGLLLGVNYNRPRFYVNIVGGYREGRPYQGSSFPDYATPVGSYFLSYFIRPWLELRSFGVRRVAYSVDVVNPYYFGMMIGGDINIQVAPRILLKGFGGVGQNKYPIPQPIGPTEGQRLDKITNYGGGASVILARRLTLTALATQRNDVSNVRSANYSLLQYSTFLTFTGEFLRTGEFMR